MSREIDQKPISMRRLPPLSALRAFEAAARNRSFKRAAAELSVTPTAISHQISTLEAYLHVRLFDRRTRQVVLTAAAEDLYPVLKSGFDAFADAIGHVTAARFRPKVTISATTAFTAKWLLPRVARFQQVNPEIDLHVHASDLVVDLETDMVDLAIRYGFGPYSGLVAEPLLEDCFALVANPILGIRKLEDLRRTPLIHFQWKRPDPGNPTWAVWFHAIGSEVPQAVPHLTFTEESHAIQAAVAGQGVALLSLALVADELAAGRLVQPFGPTLPGMTYWLVQLSGRPPTEQAAAARDWLLSEIRSVDVPEKSA